MVMVAACFARSLRLVPLVLLGLAQAQHSDPADVWLQSSHHFSAAGDRMGSHPSSAYRPARLGESYLAKHGIAHWQQAGCNHLRFALALDDGIDEVGELRHGGLAGPRVRTLTGGCI